MARAPRSPTRPCSPARPASWRSWPCSRRWTRSPTTSQRIDAKLDDVLRAQKDSVVSRLTGAGMAIDEAMTVSRARGKVDEVTWSKVQNLTTTIAEVQGYALAQLDGLAGKLESAEKVSDIASATAAAAASTQEWLAVLARTFQLQEGLDVLELDRVLDASPDEVDDHRRGLEAGPAQAAHRHRCGHRAAAGADRRRGGHRQREGPAAPDRVAEGGARQRTGQRLDPRLPRTARAGVEPRGAGGAPLVLRGR